MLAVGEERAVGGDRQHVAERLELVGAVGARGWLGRGVERAAEDLLRGDVEPAGGGVGHQRLGVVRRRRGRRGRRSARRASLLPAADGHRRDLDGVAGLGVVADVADPDLVVVRAAPAPRRPWASLPQPVTPTVSPVAGSTVKTRPVSPESLVVTTSPSTTTSPLDSMMSLSWKEKTTCASADRRGGRAEQERHDDQPGQQPVSLGMRAARPASGGCPRPRPGRRTPGAASRR